MSESTKSMMTRRQILGAGAAALALAAIRPNPSFAAGDGNIRMFWWGSSTTAGQTEDAVAMFEAANPGSTVETGYAGWDDYWPRLATEVAGRNAPDLIQMDYRYVTEYARRGALLPLDDYLDTILDIRDFGKDNLDSCSVDGKLYGANVGVNTIGLILDAAAWDDGGVQAPTFGDTWEQFADSCASFAKSNTRERFYATCDGSGWEPVFESWLLGRGKALYTADGELGFETADAADWFNYWAEIRNSGGCVPAEIQALYKNTNETSALTLGYAATDRAFSNQYQAFQSLNKQKLSMVGLPVVAGGKPGAYLKPSQMFSVSASSAHPETTIKLISFLLHSPEGVTQLALGRGVPCSPAMRELLVPTLDDMGRDVVDFITAMDPYVGPLPPAPPLGAGEINALLTTVSQEVSFGAYSPGQGADRFIAEANSILKRG